MERAGNFKSRKAIVNANIFDGVNPRLKHASIVIEDNIIKDITTEPLSSENFSEVIDAGDRVVIPGLTDAHVHLTGLGKNVHHDESVVRGVKCAKDMLMCGFTTIREAGGAVYGIKKCIDEGVIEGPRIFPSYAYISQTCGHGDIRQSRADYRISDRLYTSRALMDGHAVLADGCGEVLKAVREQLVLGASQIKIMAGGGVSSFLDPLETLQFTLEEMEAAVNAASDFGTYVMAHLYTSEQIQRAIQAGVKSLEHCILMDERTTEMIAEKALFLCPCPNCNKEDDNFDDPVLQEKWMTVRRGFEKQTELINRYDLKILFGTDFIQEYATAGTEQLLDFKEYKRRFGSFKGLKSATGNVNELIRLTTYRNPYPHGEIGVIRPGAYADILIMEADPLKDLDVLANPDNFYLIMKDGKIYKKK